MCANGKGCTEGGGCAGAAPALAGKTPKELADLLDRERHEVAELVARPLQELAGAASMAWMPRPSMAVFDAEEALVASSVAVRDVADLVVRRYGAIAQEAADLRRKLEASEAARRGFYTATVRDGVATFRYEVLGSAEEVELRRQSAAAELVRLRLANEDLLERLTTSEADRARLAGEIVELRRQRDKRLLELADAEGRGAKGLAREAELRERVDQVTQETHRQHRVIAELRQMVEGLGVERDSLRAVADRRAQEVDKAAARMVVLERERDAARHNLEQAQRDRDAEARQRQGLAQHVQDLDAKVAELELQVAAAETLASSRQEQLERVADDRQDLALQLSEAERALATCREKSGRDELALQGMQRRIDEQRSALDRARKEREKDELELRMLRQRCDRLEGRGVSYPLSLGGALLVVDENVSPTNPVQVEDLASTIRRLAQELAEERARTARLTGRLDEVARIAVVDHTAGAGPQERKVIG